MTTDLVSADEGAMVPFDAYSAQEMAYRLADFKSRIAVVQEFFRTAMVKGQDYGVIPGTEKPTLLKPGAEKLAELYGFAPVVKAIEETTGLGGFYEVKVTVALISRKTGATVAEGIGSANMFESRYRYRWVWADKLPPGIDRAGLVTRGKRDNPQYRIENDDMYALRNTVLKMAKKRSFVDAVLSATRSSGLFTQDLEDLTDWMGEAGEEDEAPRRQPSARAGRAREASVTPPRRRSDVHVREPEAGPAVDLETGEVDSRWTIAELSAALKGAALKVGDLSPVLGAEATRDTIADLIDRWQYENPGATISDLVRAAVEHHMTSEPQPAMPLTD